MKQIIKEQQAEHHNKQRMDNLKKEYQILLSDYNNVNKIIQKINKKLQTEAEITYIKRCLELYASNYAYEEDVVDEADLSILCENIIGKLSMYEGEIDILEF